MKFPKRLPVERSCVYRLPEHMTAADLSLYEIDCRRQYKTEFTGRIGNCFFFTLANSVARDVFLTSLEINCKASNLITYRSIFYSDKS